MSFLGGMFGKDHGLGSVFGSDQRVAKDYSDARFVNCGRLDALKMKIRNWNTGMVPMMRTEYFTKEELDYMHRHGI